MTNDAPKIRMTKKDHRNLTDLLQRLPMTTQSTLKNLEGELDRAEVISEESMPSDVVTMYSTVVYEDLDSGRTMKVQLTYPKDADVERGRVSVLAPVGAALLGLKVGEIIKWPLPSGRTHKLRVRQLIDQVNESTDKILAKPSINNNSLRAAV